MALRKKNEYNHFITAAARPTGFRYIMLIFFVIANRRRRGSADIKCDFHNGGLPFKSNFPTNNPHVLRGRYASC